MPVKHPSDTPPRTNRDIRDFITPPRLQRNRRIVESDSDDDQEPTAANMVQPPAPVPNDPPAPVQDAENLNPNLIVIEDSDDDSSDSMYIAATTPRVESQEQLNHQNALASPNQPQNRNVRPRRDNIYHELQNQERQRQQPLPSQRRRRHNAPRRQDQPPAQRRCNNRSRGQALLGEAESTSESESSALSADESDKDAADLYRNAILGVRNRPNAVRQVS
jgi:hypothetical protein